MARSTQVGSHRTSIYTEKGMTKVVYHNTAVVSFDPESITLDTGTYYTRTTKVRMNQASSQFDLGFRVFVKDFEWYVEWDGNTWLFYDGMILERAGNKNVLVPYRDKMIKVDCLS